MINWKVFGRKRRLIKATDYRGIYLEGVRQATGNFSQNSRCSSQDSNQAPAELRVYSFTNLFDAFLHPVCMR
jgi:hypothetical protein